ncbi:MAG: peptide chain release factor N(5)-glutamine methyltransferase [Kordiimonadaceae bacterium]|nr:peptide chain release factor N(5)-glutamine methyltransferase [Kordiimonadaceae bacterium]
MSASQPMLALVRAASETLTATGNSTAKLDAEFLLAHIMGCDRAGLFTIDRPLTEAEIQQFEAAIARRATHEPVAYIIGEQPFWTLDLKVNEHTLIPRPDTETLVEAVLKRCPNNGDDMLLDLGTGSGCILLSLLSEMKAAKGIGVDISVGALEVARDNAAANGLSDRATFIKSDWFEHVERPAAGFSVIVSNPPYIPSGDIKTLMPDVRTYEPLSALEGGADGLVPYRIIADKAGAYLADSGLLAVEVGIHQAEDVASIFRNSGLEAIEVYKDLSGIERVVSAKKTPD